MGFKDLLVKLGILKVEKNAGTYSNAEQRSEVMGADVMDTETGNDSGAGSKE
jgi:hypothetical protein